jgi:hypothetical protein
MFSDHAASLRHNHLLLVEPEAPEVPALVQAVANLGSPAGGIQGAEAVIQHLAIAEETGYIGDYPTTT